MSTTKKITAVEIAPTDLMNIAIPQRRGVDGKVYWSLGNNKYSQMEEWPKYVKMNGSFFELEETENSGSSEDYEDVDGIDVASIIEQGFYTWFA